MLNGTGATAIKKQLFRSELDHVFWFTHFYGKVPEVTEFSLEVNSVVYPEEISRIRIFFNPGSESFYPGSATNNFIIFSQ